MNKLMFAFMLVGVVVNIIMAPVHGCSSAFSAASCAFVAALFFVEIIDERRK